MPLSDAVYSIRFRLLASLFVLLGLSISISMYGIWTFERDRYMEIARAEAMRAGRTIEKSLRSAMLENDWNKIQQTVDDIQEIVQPSVVSILAFDGTVAVSSDRALIGRRLDRNAEASCTVCHSSRGLVPPNEATFLETGAGPVLRNIIKVPNAPECYGCHTPGQKNIGIVMYDAPFRDTFAMLRTVMFRTGLTGLLTFFFVIVVLSLVIQRFVHRPLHQLMAGFFQVGRGNFHHWVEVDTRGEFRDMADQFNVMSRAIGRSFIEIRQKNWETASLYTFVRQLSQAIGWNDLKAIITNLLFETFATEEVVLFLRREGKEEGLVEVARQQGNNRRLYYQEYAHGAEIADLPAWIAEAFARWQQTEATSLSFAPGDTRAVLPLASKSTAIGLLCLQRQSGKPFSEAEKKLIAAVGEQIGITLANARLYRLAITDGLTGLYAKRYGESVIRKLLDAYEPAKNNGFCVLLLDLDHFKLVNDTHGHQVGDEVLVQLASLIRTGIRYDDVACRFGGEEFIVLVAGDLEVGRGAGSRLRQAIEQHVFKYGTRLALRNTVSIGVAGFPQHGNTVEEVIAAADQALYEAKRSGRNRVVCFGEQPGSLLAGGKR